MCLETFQARTSNNKRHDDSKRKGRLSHLNTDEKREYLKKRSMNVNIKKKSLQNLIKINHEVSKSSYLASYCIAKQGKSYTDGEFLKETLLQMSEYLFWNISNQNEILQKIRDIPLSARAI